GRFSPALSDQVDAREGSLTRQPKLGFVRTLHHGAGVGAPGRTLITYSLPSVVNPPAALSKTVGGLGGAMGLPSSARVDSKRGNFGGFSTRLPIRNPRDRSRVSSRTRALASRCLCSSPWS